MMRSHFDEQLALLNKELIEMGALCEEVIELASRALAEGNLWQYRLHRLMPRLTRRSVQLNRCACGFCCSSSR